MAKKHRNLRNDFLIVAMVIVATILLERAGIITDVITYFKYPVIEAFIAGMFFTSIFTTAPAVFFLIHISSSLSLLPLSIMGGAGAVIGDLIIFYFIRDRFGRDITNFIKEKNYKNHFSLLLRFKIFRFFTFLTGVLIIASPLPDELGIGLLGLSKMRTLPFIVLSFIFNSAGIAIISYLAQTI